MKTLTFGTSKALHRSYLAVQLNAFGDNICANCCGDDNNRFNNGLRIRLRVQFAGKALIDFDLIEKVVI